MAGLGESPSLPEQGNAGDMKGQEVCDSGVTQQVDCHPSKIDSFKHKGATAGRKCWEAMSLAVSPTGQQ